MSQSEAKKLSSVSTVRSSAVSSEYSNEVIISNIKTSSLQEFNPIEVYQNPFPDSYTVKSQNNLINLSTEYQTESLTSYESQKLEKPIYSYNSFNQNSIQNNFKETPRLANLAHDERYSSEKMHKQQNQQKEILPLNLSKIQKSKIVSQNLFDELGKITERSKESNEAMEENTHGTERSHESNLTFQQNRKFRKNCLINNEAENELKIDPEYHQTGSNFGTFRDFKIDNYEMVNSALKKNKNFLTERSGPPSSIEFTSRNSSSRFETERTDDSNQIFWASGEDQNSMKNSLSKNQGKNAYNSRPSSQQFYSDNMESVNSYQELTFPSFGKMGINNTLKSSSSVNPAFLSTFGGKKPLCNPDKEEKSHDHLSGISKESEFSARIGDDEKRMESLQSRESRLDETGKLGLNGTLHSSLRSRGDSYLNTKKKLFKSIKDENKILQKSIVIQNLLTIY